ncbi:unnamed protein product [Cuscuta campestris]|uniref:Prolyl endopeptidase n=1 Tax=Cuscuta campestris TaxID=132261 RepID=A0A484MI22_9ASTE|nr:unnamed protein product [Cuscuta campestris]
MSEDGSVALRMWSVSEDAKFLAYGLTSKGTDWVTIRVMAVDDKRTLEPDTLSWVKFSGLSWTKDCKRFFYSRYPDPLTEGGGNNNNVDGVNLNHQLYYHFLGTHQSEDILCWKDSDNPKHMVSASVTEDGKYVVLYIMENCDPANKVHVCELSALPNGLEGYRGTTGGLPFTKLVDGFDASYDFVANDETIFTFHTNKNAPRDAKNVLQLRDLKTGALEHNLPIGIGRVCGISALRKDSSAFIGFTNFLIPQTIYEINLQNEVPEMKTFREVTVPGFDPSGFNVNQVFVPSRDDDRVKIPMFIVSPKGIPMDGSNPCLLYGYGGFSTSLTPCFSAARLVLAKHLGVVFCFANIRGGGEYGEEWHKAGALGNKQNCLNDFISAAEYLVQAGFTQPTKLCIEGESNGGLVMAACINQRPDLFGCALIHVGVMDMLRFHKFTIGHAWTSEFGCSDKEEEFHWLIKYSPLHNVKRPWEQTPCLASQYPSTMLLSADHDDRVVPSHTLKFLATLQHVLCMRRTDAKSAVPMQRNPIVGRIERNAGHGCGCSTQKMIEMAADRYAFMARALHADWRE